jgi:hypothetical protein
MQHVIQDPRSSCDVAEYFLKNKQSVPYAMIQSASKFAGPAQELAGAFLSYKKPVPDILIQAASKNAGSTGHVAQDFLMAKKPVPEILIQKIVEKDFDHDSIVFKQLQLASEYLARLNHVPDLLIQKISEDESKSYALAYVYVNKNKSIPEQLVKTVAKNIPFAIKITTALIEKKQTPPNLLIPFAPAAAFEIAMDLLSFDIPIKNSILNHVIQCPDLAKILAQEFENNEEQVPPLLLSHLS